jgi:hypothetical protein
VRVKVWEYLEITVRNQVLQYKPSYANYRMVLDHRIRWWTSQRARKADYSHFSGLGHGCYSYRVGMLPNALMGSARVPESS